MGRDKRGRHSDDEGAAGKDGRRGRDGGAGAGAGSGSDLTHPHPTCAMCRGVGPSAALGGFRKPMRSRGKDVYVHEVCAELSPRTDSHGALSEVNRGAALVRARGGEGRRLRGVRGGVHSLFGPPDVSAA
jgi:hypothetical protein